MEHLFDNRALLERWRANWTHHARPPAVWPEMSQAWFDQQLVGKRLIARQWLVAYQARRRALDTARSRWYRRERPVYLKSF